MVTLALSLNPRRNNSLMTLGTPASSTKAAPWPSTAAINTPKRSYTGVSWSAWATAKTAPPFSSSPGTSPIACCPAAHYSRPERRSGPSGGSNAEHRRPDWPWKRREKTALEPVPRPPRQPFSAPHRRHMARLLSLRLDQGLLSALTASLDGAPPAAFRRVLMVADPRGGRISSARAGPLRWR